MACTRLVLAKPCSIFPGFIPSVHPLSGAKSAVIARNSGTFWGILTLLGVALVCLIVPDEAVAGLVCGSEARVDGSGIDLHT